MKLIHILLFITLLQQSGFGQTGAEPAQPPAVALRPVSEEQWRGASDQLDYSDDVPKEARKKKFREAAPEPSARDWTLNTGGFGQGLQILAIILAIAGIAFGIYKMLQQPRNHAIARDGVEITLDNLEAYLHETDLDRFLRAALADHNYALAVRLYYLQIIKDLSTQNAIKWAREKTNRDYLREMRQHRLNESFRNATRHFERVWYGNLDLTETDFRRLEPEFKNLLATI